MEAITNKLLSIEAHMSKLSVDRIEEMEKKLVEVFI